MVVQISNTNEVEQLQASIEKIRHELHRLVSNGADNLQVLSLSQHLDKLITQLMCSQFADFQRKVT